MISTNEMCEYTNEMRHWKGAFKHSSTTQPPMGEIILIARSPPVAAIQALGGPDVVDAASFELSTSLHFQLKPNLFVSPLVASFYWNPTSASDLKHVMNKHFNRLGYL